MNEQFTALSKKLTKNIDGKIKEKGWYIFYTKINSEKYMLRSM